MTTTDAPTWSTVDEHVRRGKRARRTAPRSGHGQHVPQPGRPDPVEVLQAQAVGRLAELVPIRYGRMLASPFAFFRGSAALMAMDLAGTPTSGITVQLCGDAHAANFGLYASPERHLVFDLNDFDETARGPWEWDVKRLVASLEICGRDNGHAPADRERAVIASARGYRVAMQGFAGLGHLDLWYRHIALDDPRSLERFRLDDRTRAQVSRRLDKARSRDSERAARRLTTTTNGERHIVSSPPLVERLADLLTDADRVDLEARLQYIFDAYLESLAPDRHWLLQQYRRVDIARKVVGVGSVGTRCWIVLLVGRDDDDVLFLQMKEAGPSVLSNAMPRSRPRSCVERRPRGAAGRAGPAADAGRHRHLPGLAPQHRTGRGEPGLLRATAGRLEGRRRPRPDHPRQPAALRRAVRTHARPRPCPVR